MTNTEFRIVALLREKGTARVNTQRPSKHQCYSSFCCSGLLYFSLLLPPLPSECICTQHAYTPLYVYNFLCGNHHGSSHHPNSKIHPPSLHQFSPVTLTVTDSTLKSGALCLDTSLGPSCVLWDSLSQFNLMATEDMHGMFSTQIHPCHLGDDVLLRR